MSPTRKPVNKAIHCNDGFSMSVQASAHHRCKPRTNWGPYTEMEVAFPSTKEPLLLEFCDDSLKQNGLFHHNPYEAKKTLDTYIENIKAKELNDRGYDKTYRDNLIHRLEAAFLITFDLIS